MFYPLQQLGLLPLILLLWGSQATAKELENFRSIGWEKHSIFIKYKAVYRREKWTFGHSVNNQFIHQDLQKAELFADAESLDTEEQIFQQGIEQYNQGVRLYYQGEDGSDAFKLAIQAFFDCLDLINGNSSELNGGSISPRESVLLLQIADGLARAGFNLEDYGEYQLALTSLQEALKIYRFLQLHPTQETHGRSEFNEARILSFIGWIYYSLGQYELAINFNQQSIQIAVSHNKYYGQQLADIGLIYQAMQNYEKAFEYAKEALKVAQEINDSQLEAFVLSDIGSAHYAQNNFSEAVRFYQDSIRIAEPSHRWTIVSINNLGRAHQGLKEYEKAAEYYLQALRISKSAGFRAVEAQSFSNLGLLMAEQNQIDLAVVFYKQAVNAIEDIRQDSRGLSNEERRTYTATVADTYRSLSDLMLQQGRIFEAQQVLELLKVQEIREFTRAVYTTDGLIYDPLEQEVVDAHGSLIALGAEIYRCNPNCDQRLYDQQLALKRQYDQQVSEFEAIIRQSRAQDDLFYDPNSLASDALDIVNAESGTVLIYPVVLKDRLWLLWTATGGVVGRVEVPVTQAEISRVALPFRELLEEQDPESYDDFKAVSRQLYGWLIEPMAAELEQNDIRHLVFAQDRITRYLPMAALYDGNKYLIERYTVSTVLSAALTDTSDRLGDVDSSPALGLGLTQALPGFSPLPNVAEELEAAIRIPGEESRGIYPGQIFLDEAFTFEALSQNVRRSRILHIATHAEFVPGAQDASYLMLGNGEQLRIADISAIEGQMSNLHLVVLSACQTALGGEALDGTEIAGVSSYFLGKNKAETVLATLWKVDDAGTSVLMERFYEILSTGQTTKAEALRQAQLSLLYEEASVDERLQVLGLARGGFEPVNSQAADVGISHPYYWAPFVLIGNAL